MTHALLLIQSALTSGDPWAVAGRVALIITLAFGGVGVFVWRALLAKVAVVALDECTDTWHKKVDNHLQARDDATKDELRMLFANDTEQVRRLSVLDDQMEGVNAAILAQGKALADQFTTLFQRQTDAMESLARTSTEGYREVRTTIEQMRIEASETAKSVARIEGLIDRRVTPNRRTRNP